MKKKVPGEAYSDKIHARFWLAGKKSYLGIGRITLLENIIETGSINAAAKKMKMSYKKAWKIVDDVNNIYDEPLVIREKGGKSCGGTTLTPKGKSVIVAFRTIEKKLAIFLEKESTKIEL